jgi:3-hydroxy-9,10-secoandrosta-1,3,5(10)-triene-9,17-dione monooxygenase
MPTTVAPPRPTTKQDILERVAPLIPKFRERASVAEEARRLPDESIREMVDAGVARVLVPQHFGGYGLNLEAWFDIALEIGKGDASHAWCASLMSHHAHVVGMFSAEAQQAVWANSPDVIVAASIQPRTQVTPVPDGYRVSGQSSAFASGVTHSQWAIVGGLAEVDGPPEWVLFLLAPGEYDIRDTWFTAGMRGTGSNTIITQNVFVSTSRVMRIADLAAGREEGGANGGIFRLPFYFYSALTFLAPMLGTTRNAYETLRQSLIARASGPSPAAEKVSVQVGLARAAADLDAVELLLRRVLRLSDEADPPSPELVTRTLRDYARCSELLVSAVDALMVLSGTAGFSASSPIQRAWRDVHFASSHVGLDLERNYTAFGRGELGLDG